MISRRKGNQKLSHPPALCVLRAAAPVRRGLLTGTVWRAAEKRKTITIKSSPPLPPPDKISIAEVNVFLNLKQNKKNNNQRDWRINSASELLRQCCRFIEAIIVVINILVRGQKFVRKL